MPRLPGRPPQRRRRAQRSPAKTTATAGGGSQPGGNGNPAAPIDDTKIVRTGSLELTVADTDKALVTARDAIRAMGGYVGSSQQKRADDSILASVTYRIPVARWEDALDALRGLGKVLGEQTDAAEVTSQLVDLDARIRNLKASETALVGYAAQAPKTSDLLEIEARLTDTRGEIERLSAQQATLSDQAAMATLTVTMGTEAVAVTQAAANWDPAAEVDRASATLIGVGRALVSFGIVFAIVWLPILAGLAIVAFVGLGIARRVGWRRPERPAPDRPNGAGRAGVGGLTAATAQRAGRLASARRASSRPMFHDGQPVSSDAASGIAARLESSAAGPRGPTRPAPEGPRRAPARRRHRAAGHTPRRARSCRRPGRGTDRAPGRRSARRSGATGPTTLIPTRTTTAAIASPCSSQRIRSVARRTIVIPMPIPSHRIAART